MKTSDLLNSKATREMLEEVTTTELLASLLLFGDNRWFTDQKIFRWLSLFSDDLLKRRWRIFQGDGGLHSDPITRVLDFFTIGMIVEESMECGPNRYRRIGSGNSLRKDLAERAVLPVYEELLRKLAESFWQIPNVA